MPSREELTDRFWALGFRVSEVAFFGSEGLWVSTKPISQQASEGSVFVYPSGDSWIVRVTPQGGPHWISRATTMSEIEALVRQVLDVGLARWKSSAEWSAVSAK